MGCMVSVRGLVGDDSTVLSSGSAICVQTLMAPHGNPVHFDVVLDCLDSKPCFTSIVLSSNNVVCYLICRQGKGDVWFP